jgi:hypothetical protein
MITPTRPGWNSGRGETGAFSRVTQRRTAKNPPPTQLSRREFTVGLNEKGLPEVSVCGSFGYTGYDNTSQAIVRGGAKLNQMESLQNEEQEVAVQAETDMVRRHTAPVAGRFRHRYATSNGCSAIRQTVGLISSC